jgi:hypothetical protein
MAIRGPVERSAGDKTTLRDIFLWLRHALSMILNPPWVGANNYVKAITDTTSSLITYDQYIGTMSMDQHWAVISQLTEIKWAESIRPRIQ